MSFLSMLQMAKGKETPPQPQRTPPAKSASTSNRPTPSQPVTQKLSSSDLYKSSASSAVAPKPVDQTRPQSMPKPVQRSACAPSSAVSPRPATTSLRSPVPSSHNNAFARPPQSSPATPEQKPAPRPKSASPSSATLSSGGIKKTDRSINCGKKRLSFKDVMKQAETIDKSKLQMNLRIASKKEQATKPKASRRKGSQPDAESSKEPREQSQRLPGRRSTIEPDSEEKQRVASDPRTPAPVAQPLPELMEKYRQKQMAKQRARGGRRADDDDSDLDDFVVDEDEEIVEDIGRDDSIWSMFNRKPKYSYRDDGSDDDMEATGRDIFDEERRSAAQARREDIEEERKLEELARRKQQRRA